MSQALARLTACLLAVACLALAAIAPRAQANPVGYEPADSHSLPGPPRGMTVDPGSEKLYVAITSTNPSVGTPGEIVRLLATDLSTDAIFAPGGGFYSGVALDPVGGGFFGAQMQIPTSFGNVGTPELDRFGSTGAAEGSFPLAFTDSLPPIATDAAGRIYYPNVNTHTVRVLESDGTLHESLDCGDCPGGPFGKPASVAFDAAGDLYVADASPDRVVKLTPGGGSYEFSSLIQSGEGAGAVAVDPGNGDVFVGDMPSGSGYHIVAYDSSGTELDDFGAGMFGDSPNGYGALSAYQMTVNGSTHDLYAGEFNKLYVFEMGEIGPPVLSLESASGVGQLGATLNASVEASSHSLLECEFEYVDEADFLADGFNGSTGAPCEGGPSGAGGFQVTAPISGLSPATSYRYRLTASTYGGSETSSGASFETLPELPPVVSTEAAREVTQSMATIAGAVDPRGGSPSECRFELGGDASYGTSLPCTPLPGPATSPVSEARQLSGLSPATTYHYRLVVTTNAGTSAGDDVAFTTAAAPPAEAPEPSASEPTPAPQPAAPAPSVAAPSAPPSVASPHRRRCRKGFRRRRVHGRVRCLKTCRKGFRRRRVRHKVRCVRRHTHRRHRRHRRRHAHAKHAP